VKFLLDTDHISILQRQAGPEFAALSGRTAQQQPADLAFSVVSFHEQVLGCHTYLSRARTSAAVARGFDMQELEVNRAQDARADFLGKDRLDFNHRET
jgi:tRNA(fMet)-specific endonuclease VapC